MKKQIITSLIVLVSFAMHAQILTHTQGEILVQVSSQEDVDKIISNISALRRSHAETKRLAPHSQWYSILFDFTKYNENEVLDKVRKNKRTVSAQFNHILRPRQKNPNDSLFKNQWQWFNNGVNGKTRGIDSKVYQSWYKTTGGTTKQGKEIVVAVIDDGTELSHPDLQNNMYINKFEIPGNKMDDDENGYVDDYLGWNVLGQNDSVSNGQHGVGVAGLIGARGNNTTGVSGVNWNIKILNLKYDVVNNAIKESDAITAYAYLIQQRKLYNESFGAKGAFIVASNASWGLDDAKPSDAPLWCAIYDSLGKVGILNVSATDNVIGKNVDTIGDLPTLCPSEYLLSSTSIGSDGKREGAFGPKNIDLAAPGDRVFTTRFNSGYGLESGTSFAAPLVTGAIGLLYANQCNQLDNLTFSNPAAAALLVRDAILKGVDTISTLRGMVKTNGYLNIRKALDNIQSFCTACASGGLDSRIYIDSLVIGGLKFRSRDNRGYGDFTGIDSLTPTITHEGQLLLKIFPRSKDSINFYYVRIWIDRNLDKDFNDTAELVWSSGDKFINGNIVSNIYLAPTKIDSTGKSQIRIALKAVTNIGDTSKPTPCDFFTAGEVEDYSINILPKDFNCPDALELVSAEISEEGATINYQQIIPKLFYIIRYKEASDRKWDTLPTRDTMVKLTGLKKCTDYIVESKTVCDSDSSRFKTMLKFKTPGCTVPLRQDISIANISTWPNPFTNQFNIRLNSNESIKNVKLRLVSLSGKVHYLKQLGSISKGEHQYSMNQLEQYAAGVYFIQVITDKGITSKRIIKI